MEQENSSFATEAEPSGTWRVVARGELDMASSDQLSTALEPALSAHARLVIVDLSDVTFLDSSGLRAIVRASNALQDAGGRLVVEGVSGAVARVLEVTGLLEHLRHDAPEP